MEKRWIGIMVILVVLAAVTVRYEEQWEREQFYSDLSGDEAKEVWEEKGWEPGETVTYMDMECIAASNSSDQIMKQYLTMLDTGREEGYIPFIIFKNDSMDEIVSDTEESLEEKRDHVLEEYPKIEPEEWFQEQEKWLGGQDMVTLREMALWGKKDTVPELYIPYDTESTLIAKIPVRNPWEVFAYVPFGGWNFCPMNEEHAAIAKYWYELYGAVPCAAGTDTLQYYLEKPVTEKAAVEELSKEMFLYCQDIVDQGVGTLGGLEAATKGSRLWFFWWD